MHRYFERRKPQIISELGRQIAVLGRDLARVNAWGPDAARRLLAFASEGKMVRGGLLALSAEMHGSALGRPIFAAAAAMELLHSSLLVHDDIMDNDRLRRGAPTLFAQYERLARRTGRTGPAAAESFGRSMGICAGDVGYFLAWDILSRLAVPPRRRAALLSLVARELAYVGIAQMQDVAFGAFPRMPQHDDVLDLYRYKTARYTFSLPLAAGAILAGAGQPAVRRLVALGTYLGVIFQIRDDDIGIFGSRRLTGKPVGSDIREGKKTLLYLECLRRAGGPEKKSLASLLGKPGLTAADVRTVRKAAERLGARQRLAELMDDLAREARRTVDTLDIADMHRAILREICAESARRLS
jgi:geranylgeranyl diphosphate synthase type I